MGKPLVSICCLTYNHEPYLRQCLEGFMIQKTNFPFEVLIHDDASTDRTAEIIREYELKYPNIIIPIYQAENKYSKGVGVTRVYQFPRARGKYIAMCEGDDYWIDPYKLQKQVDFLEEHTDFSATGHQTEVIFENDPDEKELFSSCRNHTNTKKKVIQSNVFHTSSIVFRRQALMKYDLLNSKTLVEHALFILIAQSGKFYYFNETMSVYRKHNSSISGTSTPEKAYPGQIAWISAVKDILGWKFFWGYHFLTAKVHLHYAIYHPYLINISTLKKFYYYLKYTVLVILMYPRNFRAVIRLFPVLVRRNFKNEI